jgi:hypothetical protein
LKSYIEHDMTNKSDHFKKDWLGKADAAIARGDYLQAIAYHEELIQRLSEQSEREAIDFRDGPYAELLLAAIKHAHELADRSHYTVALDLVRTLRPRFAEWQEMVWVLNGLEERCLQRALYTRSSPRASDVLLCCSEAEQAELQSPLAAALDDLGVLVATEPFVVSTLQSGASLTERLSESDVVVVVLSPSFFAANWPQDELHGLLKASGPNSGRVLPVWHSISRPEVLAASEPLEKTLAFDTSKSSLSEIAQGIADIVRPDLASGALHKVVWAAILQGKTLGQAFTEFELPVRHDSLDDDLVARIRLIRAAFMDGCRQTMKSWIDGFCRELEPYPAIVEWEKLARAFQEAQALQRQLNTVMESGSAEERETFLAQLVPDTTDAEVRHRMLESYLELAQYPSDRLFILIWAASLPISRNVDLDFPPGLLALASFILQSGRPMLEPVDDFDDLDFSVDLEINVWDAEAEGEDWSEGVLHTKEERPWSKPWDVFISHASEDKAQLVHPLAEALKEYGVKVWYDSFTLRPGLSLGRSIDAGIDAAEFGIIVLSPHFIAKEWPRYEFDAMRQRQADQGDRLITLWHGLTPEDGPAWVQGLDPATGLDTAAQSITALMMRVLERVRPDLARFTQRRLKHAAMLERLEKGQVRMERLQLSEMTVGPRRYERLPEELVARVRLVRAVLFEVAPHSMKYWLEGFLRDHNPEREIGHWQQVAAMYQEAIYVVDWLQEESRKGLRQLWKRQGPKLEHQDVYYMLNSLVHVPEEHSQLPEFRQEYPEDIVDTIQAIVASPTVIDVLDPD